MWRVLIVATLLQVVSIGGSVVPIETTTTDARTLTEPAQLQAEEAFVASDDVYDDPVEYVYDSSTVETEELDPAGAKNKRNTSSPKEKTDSCARKKNGERVAAGPPTFKKRRLHKLSVNAFGHRHVIRCPYRSCPPAKVSWKKDGKEVKERKARISGRSIIHRDDAVGMLTIEDNREEDEGLYTCSITNSYGSISHTIEVKSATRFINAPPDIKQPLANQTVEIGSDLTLVCEPTFNDAGSPNDIVWYRHFQVNGSWTSSKGNSTVHHANVIQASSDYPPPVNATQLVMTNLQENDTSWYSCVIKNNEGQKHSTAFITVTHIRPPINWLGVVLGVVLAVGLLVLIVCSLLVWRCASITEKATGEPVVIRTLLTKRVVVKRPEPDAGGDFTLSPEVHIVKYERSVQPEGGEQVDPVTDYEFPEDPEWEFPREDLRLLETLGEGEFGRVVDGEAKGTIRNGRLVASPTTTTTTTWRVAVKMVKEEHTESDIEDLVREAEIMKVIGQHENIVNLLGVCSQPRGQPLLVIVEFAQHGNLKDYLRQRKSATECYIWSLLAAFAGGHDIDLQTVPENCEQYVSLKQMLSFALQVAKGMEFLSSRRCVHRDLAARNVLVAGDGVAKVADFGMARDLKESDYYYKQTSGRIPMLWTAPESLIERIYTTQSDVWSYGILLWEIVTFAEQPYRCLVPINALNIEEFPKKIRAGYRMQMPDGCPFSLYDVMLHCWELKPEQRPSWNQLVETVYQLYQDTQPGRYLDLPPVRIPTPPPIRAIDAAPISSFHQQQRFTRPVVSSVSSWSYVPPDSASVVGPSSTLMLPVSSALYANQPGSSSSSGGSEQYSSGYSTWITVSTRSTASPTEERGGDGSVGTVEYAAVRPVSPADSDGGHMEAAAGHGRNVNLQQQQYGWQPAGDGGRLPTEYRGSLESGSTEEEEEADRESVDEFSVVLGRLLEKEGGKEQDIPPPLPPKKFVRSISEYRDRMRNNSRHDSESEAEQQLQLPTPTRLKKRGSSESGYGTQRESESSEVRLPLFSSGKSRHISDDDSVFMRE